MTIKAILDDKGNQVHCVARDSKISEALQMFKLEEVGALVVSQDGKRIDGIVSERDVVLALADQGPSLLEQSVNLIMTHDVLTCAPRDRILDVMALMSEKHIRHVPVVAEGTLCGIVSIGDIVKERLEEVEADASAMHRYITGAA